MVMEGTVADVSIAYRHGADDMHKGTAGQGNWMVCYAHRCVFDGLEEFEEHRSTGATEAMRLPVTILSRLRRPPMLRLYEWLRRR